jgi:hypothetical protein
MRAKIKPSVFQRSAFHYLQSLHHRRCGFLVGRIDQFASVHISIDTAPSSVLPLRFTGESMATRGDGSRISCCLLKEIAHIV